MMKLYISGVGIWILVLFYAPLVLIGLIVLWRKLPKHLAIRIGVTAVAAVLAAGLPLLDVVTTSYQIAQLCPEAGLKVYKSVRADGYLSNFGTGSALERGFRYLEVRNSRHQISIYAKEGPKTVKSVVDPASYVPKSRYEFKYGEALPLNGSRHIAMTHSLVLDRVTGEILGEAIAYTIVPGWVDQSTAGLVQHFAWRCPNDSILEVRLLEQVLQPDVH